MPRATYKVWKGIFRVCSRLAGHFGDITFLQAAWMGGGAWGSWRERGSFLLVDWVWFPWKKDSHNLTGVWEFISEAGVDSRSRRATLVRCAIWRGPLPAYFFLLHCIKAWHLLLHWTHNICSCRGAPCKRLVSGHSPTLCSFGDQRKERIRTLITDLISTLT